MKKISRRAITLVMILFSAQLIYGQDLSKYRSFSFGTSAAIVSKQAGLDARELFLVHQRPALIQELTWYPPQPYGSSRPAEPVDKILFSFDNDELYRMLVTYDSSAIKGLTDEDMIQAISAKYGVAAKPVADVNFPTNTSYRSVEKVIARWEDSQYSFNLIRPSGSSTFAIFFFITEMTSSGGFICQPLQTEPPERRPEKKTAVKQKRDRMAWKGLEKKPLTSSSHFIWPATKI